MSDFIDIESLMRLRGNVASKWSFGSADAHTFYEAMYNALPRICARMLRLSLERDDLVIAAAKLHAAMKQHKADDTKEAYRELMTLAKVRVDE